MRERTPGPMEPAAPAGRPPADAGGVAEASGPPAPRLPLALAALVLVTLALPACQRPLPDDGETEDEDAGLAERVEGCWELAAAGDDDRETVRNWIEEGALPGAVRLDSARAEMGAADDSFFVAWSYVHSRRQRRPLAAWRRVGPDSIRVETPGALSGTVLRLGVSAERLEGTATVFSDVIRPGEDPGGRDAGVEARPADCPD